MPSNPERHMSQNFFFRATEGSENVCFKEARPEGFGAHKAVPCLQKDACVYAEVIMEEHDCARARASLVAWALGRQYHSLCSTEELSFTCSVVDNRAAGSVFASICLTHRVESTYTSIFRRSVSNSPPKHPLLCSSEPFPHTSDLN